MLVTFTDEADPSSIVEVQADDFRSAFGPGYNLRKIRAVPSAGPLTREALDSIPLFRDNILKMSREQPVGGSGDGPRDRQESMMIQSLLIANRGEIACRIMRTARQMGIRTVAVYSDADATALHVRQADDAVHIGPSPARESYLVGEKIIAAAKATGAEAIHPGYGFLSENAEFAQSVIDAGLIWVGPNPASITAMGLKDAAKKLMAEAGVPVTPGYMGENQDPAFLAERA
eukprot:gene31061-53303_t